MKTNRLKKGLNRCVAIFCFLLLSIAAKAQDIPLIVNVTILPPYSTDVSVYLGAADQTAISITNPNLGAKRFFLAGSITNLASGQSIIIPASQNPGVPPIVVEGGATLNLAGTELQQYFNSNSLQLNGISQQELINGNVPEGIYQLCLQAIDYETLQPLSLGEPVGCSLPFPVVFVQPPITIAPACSTEVVSTNPQNIMFTWTPPIGILQGSNLQYRIKVAELPEGGNPLQVLQSTTTPLVNDSTFNTFYFLSSLSPQLQPGREFVWQVTVRDLNGQLVFSNQGQSDVCTFKLALPFGVGPVQARLAYPKPGTRIPFRNAPLVARFDPLVESFRGYFAETSLLSPAGQDLNQTQQNWPAGREAFMDQQLTTTPVLEQMLHISVGRNLRLSPGSGTFGRGELHTVLSDIRFSKDDGTEQQADLSGSFEAGMPKPKLVEPVRDTTLQNHVVTLKFNADNFPTLVAGQNYLLPPPDIQKSLTGTDPYLFVAQIEEQYKLEIARNADFDSIVKTIYGSYRVKDTITANKSEESLRLKLKKQISEDVFLPDTGFYYWRVSWLKNNVDTSSVPYITSDTEKFLIIDGIAGEQVNSSCMADCDAPPITNRTPVTTIVRGDSVSIGKFKMKVTDISYIGNAARGKGIIRVPFFGANIKVNFSEIQINAQKQVFFGSVGAEYDNTGLIPNIPGIGEVTFNLPDADSLDAFLESQHELVTTNPDAPMGLPLGIDKTIDGERIMIAVMAASFRPDKATLAAGINIPLFGLLNGEGGGINKISLAAADVCFHPTGLAGVRMGTLFMPEDVEIMFADKQKLLLKGTRVNLQNGAIADSGCYVSWDCDGFRALRIQGAVDFDTSLLVKENLAGEIDLTKHVNARFAFTVRRTGNWLAHLDFDRFQIPGVKGWGFDVKDATLDFSDLENPISMTFPQGYQGDRSVLWNGFFLKEMVVHMPKEFGAKEGEEPDPFSPRVNFSVQNFIIDHTGFSGTIGAQNLLNLQEGKCSGWGFSVDSIGISFVSNSFTSGGFKGRMLTPISPSEFKYNSTLSQVAGNGGLRYEFRVQPAGDIEIPMWKAQMNILPTSIISIVADTGGFKPTMLLNGNIGINTNLGTIPINFVGMHFQELKLETRAPFISCSTFSVSSPPKFMAGFPVSIRDISLSSQASHGLISWDNTPGERLALNFSLDVNFTGQNPSTLSGSTSLAVLARVDLGDLARTPGTPDPNPNAFDFPSIIPTGVDLRSIAMNADMGAVKIEGIIQFYAEDPTFGTGFNGSIKATFVKMFKVDAVLGFGSKSNNRYWYVDAAVTFTPGIPIPPVEAGMELYGFGGGAFYNMTMQSNTPAFPPQFPNPALPPANEIPNTPPPAIPPPGTLLSGIALRPSSGGNFGLLATIKFGSIGGGQVYNSDVTLAVQFSSSGGVQMITLVGDTYFMSSVLDRSFTAVNARAQLSYDFSNMVLTGSLNTKVNVPLVIRGRASDNSVGIVNLYAGPDKWNILIGTPTSRIQVKIIELFDFDAYLMMGSEIPPPAIPPPGVHGYQVLRSPGIQNGSGISFGASFSIDYNESFGPFYGNLNATAGFDINLLNVGSANCDGLSAGTKPGINGWYASGQLYGLFDGSLGMRFEFMGAQYDLEFFDAKASVLLQGGLPNPYWFKGKLYADYDFLGGLVSGTCEFKIEQGEKCSPSPESPLANIKMINDALPVASAADVDPAIIPSAAFNVDVDTEMRIDQMNANGTSTPQTVRFKITEYSLKKGSTLVSPPNAADGSPVGIAISSDKSRASLQLVNLLEAFTQYTLTIKVAAQVRAGNGSWGPLKRKNGSDITEQLSYSFTTGPLPDKILPSMVQFSMPFDRQRFFPTKTCDIGFIQTRQNISSIFTAPRSGYERKYYARFMPVNGGAVTETDASYNASSRRMNFTLPVLNKSTKYRMQIIHRDIRIANSSGTSAASSIGFQNAIIPQISVQFQSMLNNAILLRLRTLSNEMALSANEHLYYEYYFGTSQFDTYSQKIATMDLRTPEFPNPPETEEIIALPFYMVEQFDRADMYGYSFTNTNGTPGRVRAIAVQDAAIGSWYTDFARPVIYDLYDRIKLNNYNTRSLSRPNPDPYGIPAYGIDWTSFVNLLSDSEVGIPVPSSGGSSGVGLAIDLTLAGGQNTPQSGINPNIQFGNTPPPPPAANSAFFSEVGFYAKRDYDRVALMIAEMRTRYGANFNTSVDATTRSKITTFTNTPFKKRSSVPSNFTINMRNNASLLNCTGPGALFSLNKVFTVPQVQLFIQTPLFVR